MNSNLYLLNRMGDDNYLSVIVVDNKRKRFLRNAVNSIINQTLHRDRYEIIAVINYDDEEIISWLLNHQVSVIRTNEENGGALYAKGIKESMGEVLVFLDDDDMLVSNKLEYVNKTFLERADLGFLHNNVILIDELEHTISCSQNDEFKHYACAKNYRDKIYVRNSDISVMLGNLISKTPRRDPFFYLGFNSSSISVRRGLPINYLDKLHRLNFAQDNLHFLEALMSDYSIMHDPLPLTYYRIHGSSFTQMDHAIMGQRIYNDYSIISGIGKKYLADLEIDIDLCEIAAWMPMLRYAILNMDVFLTIKAAFGLFKNKVKM